MKTKLVILLVILLATGGSLFAQGEGTPVRIIFGSGVPSGGVAHTEGTQYVDNSVNPAVLYVCTSVSVATGPTPPAGTQTCNWTSAGSANTSLVSSLPGTCTPGTTANVTLSVFPFQEWQCGPTANTWYPFNATNTVSPLSYGAKWDVKNVNDCVFTNLSNTVTCPAGEAQWSSADLGKIFSGRSFPGSQSGGCNGAVCGSEVISGFICTINSADSIAIGTTYPGCAASNATATCTFGNGTHNCSALWGTQDDSTAIQNAATAAWTSNSCKALVFPAGMAFITIPSGGLLNVPLSAGSACAGSGISDQTQAGAVVAGQGMGNSVLVPLSSVNFANCTAGQSGKACISGPGNWSAHDWGVWGFGLADNGTTHNNNLIEFYGQSPGCTATAAWNMAFNNWEAASTSSQGFVFGNGCGVLYTTNIVSEAFGNTPCSVTSVSGTQLTMNAMDCFGSNGVAAAGGASLLATLNGGQINSTGGLYWGVNAIVAAIAVKLAGTGGTFNSFSDLISGPQNGNNDSSINFSNGTGTITLNLTGTTATQTNSSGAGNAYLIACFAGGNCNVNSFSSTLQAIGTKMSMFSTTAGKFKFFDGCSNQFTQGSIANTAISVFGSCSITGTTIAAGNLVLSAGWGTTAAWSALSGSTQQVFGTITASGTGQAANPTITYTFPTPFLQTPTGCFALQIGGTQAAVANPFTPSALTATGVTFTYNGTPVAGNTLVVQIQCWNP